MKAVNVASGYESRPRPRAEPICIVAAHTPDELDPKSGARARARAAEWRGRLVGQRKEPA
jgi:hypothetical protein